MKINQIGDIMDECINYYTGINEVDICQDVTWRKKNLAMFSTKILKLCF